MPDISVLNKSKLDCETIELFTSNFLKNEKNLNSIKRNNKLICYCVLVKNISSNSKISLSNLISMSDEMIMKKFNAASINYVSKNLSVPRETVRRNISSLTNNKTILRNQKGLYISSKWLENNVDDLFESILNYISLGKKLQNKINISK